MLCHSVFSTLLLLRSLYFSVVASWKFAMSMPPWVLRISAGLCHAYPMNDYSIFALCHCGISLLGSVGLRLWPCGR